MSLNQEERNAVVSLEYEKAYSTFCNIPTLVENEMWDFVANRLYYSAFHAVLALLINDGHKTSTHRGLGALFGLHYVKTGASQRKKVECSQDCKACGTKLIITVLTKH